jgi:hypothetical protein
MILNEKIINYKILDLHVLYNFDVKFDLIQDLIKKLWIFCVEPFVDGPYHHLPLKIHL